MEFLKYLLDHLDEVLEIAGGLTVVAGLVARLTPNKTDDHWVAVLEGWLARAGSLFLKPGKVKP